MSNFLSLQYLVSSFGRLLTYLPLTIGIMAAAILVSVPLGFGLAALTLHPNAFVRGVIRVYAQIIRGTPFIVLLFIVYFGLPKLFLNTIGVDINGWYKPVYVVITMVIFESAYMSEMMRSAYLAVPSGQMEACLSSGLNKRQGFLHVMLPQALYIVLPNLSNTILSILLDTAVGFSVGVIDFVGNARLINTREYGMHTLEIYLAVALTYWGLSLLIAQLFDVWRSRLGKRQGIGALRA